MNALARHMMVVHTSSSADHHDPRTVIFTGGCAMAACGGTATMASCATSSCCQGCHARLPTGVKK